MYSKATVTPGARKETIQATGEHTFTITVRESAQQNRANTRVRELLAQHFNVPVQQVRIVTGHRSRSKIVSIDN